MHQQGPYQRFVQGVDLLGILLLLSNNSSIGRFPTQTGEGFVMSKVKERATRKTAIIMTTPEDMIRTENLKSKFKANAHITTLECIASYVNIQGSHWYR